MSRTLWATFLWVTLQCGVAWATRYAGNVQPTVFVAPRADQRVGPSTAATGRAIVYTVSQDKGATHQLSEIWIRTGALYAPGDWTARFLSPTGAVLETWTQTLVPDAWNRITLPTPQWIVPSMSLPRDYQLFLEPVGSAEMGFVNAQLASGWCPFQPWGNSTLVPQELPAPRQGYVTDDAGTLRPIDGTSMVIVLADVLDPSAPTQCDGGSMPLALGTPYVDWPYVAVSAGSTAIQTFGAAAVGNGDAGIKNLGAYVQPNGAAFLKYEFSTTTDVIGGGLMDSSGNSSSYAVQWSGACEGYLPADSTLRYRLTLTPLDGGVLWMRATAGTGLSACDAPARATFAGSTGTADGDPAADYLFNFELSEFQARVADRDGDHFGRDEFGSPWCAPQRFQHLNDDCDDQSAEIHPGAIEVCNGVDDNCDALMDSADPALEVTPCELDGGICAGSNHTNSECVNGEWEACGAANYGQSFSAIEPTVCDGIDNDCDGFTDDEDSDFTLPPCSLQTGVCSGAHLPSAICVDGGFRLCGSAEYGEHYESDESTCDGLDNDCDGVVDEGCEQPDAAVPPSTAIEPPPSTEHASCGCAEAGPSAALLWAALALVFRVRRRQSNFGGRTAP